MQVNKLKTEFARSLRQNQTNVEKLLWAKLRDRRLRGIKFRRQQPIGFFIVDFVSIEKKLIIELDGGQHNTETGKRYDKRRKLWLENEGYNVLRFWNNEVLTNMDGILDLIGKSLTPPSPRRRG